MTTFEHYQLSSGDLHPGACLLSEQMTASFAIFAGPWLQLLERFSLNGSGVSRRNMFILFHLNVSDILWSRKSAELLSLAAATINLSWSLRFRLWSE